MSLALRHPRAPCALEPERRGLLLGATKAPIVPLKRVSLTAAVGGEEVVGPARCPRRRTRSALPRPSSMRSCAAYPRLRQTPPDTGGDATVFVLVQRAWELVGTAERAPCSHGFGSGPGVPTEWTSPAGARSDRLPTRARAPARTATPAGGVTRAVPRPDPRVGLAAASTCRILRPRTRAHCAAGRLRARCSPTRSRRRRRRARSPIWGWASRWRHDVVIAGRPRGQAGPRGPEPLGSVRGDVGGLRRAGRVPPGELTGAGVGRVAPVTALLARTRALSLAAQCDSAVRSSRFRTTISRRPSRPWGPSGEHRSRWSRRSALGTLLPHLGARRTDIGGNELFTHPCAPAAGGAIRLDGARR